MTQTKQTETKPSTFKPYTVGWMAFGTYLGGPMAGGYFLAQNFKQLGDQRAAQNSLWGGVATAVAMIALLLVTPTPILDKIPNSLIPLTYTAILYMLAMRFQGAKIQDYVSDGGEKQSGWKVAGIALLFLLLTLAITIGLVLVLPEALVLS